MITSTGDISFYEDQGSTPKFHWSAADESLTIGDAATQAPLSVETNSSGFAISIEENAGAETWQIGVDVDGDLNFHNSTLPTPQFTVSDSGNVTINSGDLDVTGTVTADGLIVDGDVTLGNGATLNIDDQDSIVFGTYSGGSSGTLLQGGTSTDYSIRVAGKLRQTISTGGDISFYDSQGSSQSFFWDASAEALSVGSTTNNSAAISATIGTGNYAYRMYRTDGQEVGGLYNATNGAGLFLKDSSGNSDVVLSSYGDSYFNSGNVGIGVTDPIYSLEVQGEAGIELYNGTGGGNVLNFRPSLGDANKFNLSISSYDHSGGGVGPADGLSINGFDGVSFATGSSTLRQERMRITPSGRVGIGTSSPSAVLDSRGGVNSTHAVFTGQANRGLAISTTNTLSNDDGVVYNAQTAGSGKHIFQTAGAEAMRIDSSGNLIVGGTTDSAASSITLQNDGDIRGVLASGAGGDTLISAISGVSNGYQISVDASNNQTYKWHNGGTQSMILDSSGNLLVNRSSAFTTAKTEIQSDAGDPLTLALNSIDSDGNILSFYKAGSTVGSIGSVAGVISYMVFDPRTSGSGLTGVGQTIRPTDENGAYDDAAIDLGSSGVRFKDLYLSGGVVFGDAGGSGTSTSNTLDSYEEGTFTPTAFGNSTAGTTTYGSQTGSYTKVGDTVHVDIYISWTAMTGTGDLRIGGLPFTSSSASNYFATGTIVPLLGFTWPSGATQLNPIISASDTAMSIFGSATDSNSDGAATDNEIVALAITITYKV